jgi:hypothetical protein
VIIANIISDTKINLPLEYNLVTSKDDCDPNLATLIVGWNKAKELVPDFNIMNKVIGNGWYWTFTKNEKRSDFEVDIMLFSQHAIDHLVNDISYVYIDPIHYKLKKIKKILKKINESEKIISYIHNDDIMYIYADKIIFGVDLNVLRYIGINIDRLKDRINKISDVVLSGENILIEYKIYMELLKNQYKYIPYLYSISEDE